VYSYGRCIPFAICVSKWKVVSPRLGINGFHNLQWGSHGLCWNKHWVKYLQKIREINRKEKIREMIQKLNFTSSKRYFKIRVGSKYSLAKKVHDNFIDEKMPLSVTSFCVDNIISVLVILKESTLRRHFLHWA